MSRPVNNASFVKGAFFPGLSRLSFASASSTNIIRIISCNFTNDIRPTNNRISFLKTFSTALVRMAASRRGPSSVICDMVASLFLCGPGKPFNTPKCFNKNDVQDKVRPDFSVRTLPFFHRNIRSPLDWTAERPPQRFRANHQNIR